MSKGTDGRIEIRNLGKTYTMEGTRIEALKGINLDIHRGETLAILGSSGAGKSTLLHILGTLDHPTEGSFLYDGVNIFEWDEKKLADFRNRKVGFVFQFHHLLPEFSSLENTMLPALIAGMTWSEARRKAEEILGEVGLTERLTHKPGELSGGEQQRVAVARALVMEPEMLLADEPTGNLDSETGTRIHEMLVNLNHKRGITLIVVTHNQSLAERMARCIGLRDGQIIKGA
ncbi:MAG TPA: ABC transporter ATP-binding protein [Syntrophales bacterium]|nr:ABC transporter ATP-binding protein [Syntrophales bacterium]